MGEEIYVSTTRLEVIELLDLYDHIKYGICTEDFDEEIVKKEGLTLSIADLSMKYGEKIKKDRKLGFNPMSVLSGEIDEKNMGNLIKKLTEQGLWVAFSNNGNIEHFPKKEDYCYGFNSYIGEDYKWRNPD
jgi:hypothetical protein